MENQTETEYFKKIVFSAIEGDGESMKKIGDLLWDGEGLEKDEERALQWYALAADKGWFSERLLNHYEKETMSPKSLEIMEVWLLKGGACDKNKDFINRHKECSDDFWIDIAIKYNLLDKFAWLINCHYSRLGAIRCNKWLSKAIEEDNAVAMYARGRITTGEEAIRWYTEAAERGYQSAISQLGQLYRHGEWQGDKVDIDYEKAIYWFERSSSNYERSLAKDLKQKMAEEQ